MTMHTLRKGYIIVRTDPKDGSLQPQPGMTEMDDKDRDFDLNAHKFHPVPGEKHPSIVGEYATVPAAAPMRSVVLPDTNMANAQPKGKPGPKGRPSGV